ATRAADATRCSGTLGYIAPEVFDGNYSPRSDVFALTATLFHLVVGHKPFDSKSLSESRRQAAAGLAATALSALPAAVAEIVRAGLEPVLERRTDLLAFAAMLRGCHTAGLADRLRALSADRPRVVKLNVTVSTANEKELIFRTVFSGSVTESTAVL